MGLPENEEGIIAEPVDTGPSVADTVTNRMLIDEGLAGLPEDFRAAVVLRDLCQLDYAEIAEILGIPSGTVRSRIARGRSQLADRISRNQPDVSRRQTS